MGGCRWNRLGVTAVGGEAFRVAAFGLLALWLSLAGTTYSRCAFADEAASQDGDAKQAAADSRDVPPDYLRDVAPILQKYCAGCHNEDDRDGDFSVESFASLQRGGENGVAILAGDAPSSRLIRVLVGQADPKMPPEGEPAPSAEQIALLGKWIEAGAKGPSGAEPDRTMLRTPQIPAPPGLVPAATSLAWSPDGRAIAVGRYGRVEIRDAQSGDVRLTLDGLPGKVNAVEFSPYGSLIVTASGTSGLFGHAAIWNAIDGSLLREITAHRDTLYAATLQPGGKLLATAGYDRRIVLWDIETGETVRELTGHNDAVYDLAFSPDGSVVASASGDHTVKLWSVATGERLDTLSQPLQEQYVVAFSPNGRNIVAGGADNRIRVWQFVSKTRPRINPLVHARFAHEGPILQIGFSPDGKSLVSLAEDRTLKLWETAGYTQVHAYDEQPDVAAALAVSNKGERFIVGRMDGTIDFYPIDAVSAAAVARVEMPAAQPMDDAAPMNTLDEAEPNDSADKAQPIALPATIRGAIHSATTEQDASAGAKPSDADVYRFAANAGQEWVVEVKAARDKSPLDSYVEVLDREGKPITRALLQAVRDSYFTFRGKDSDTSDDFRVHNWEEMELNEYLFANGEVVKLWLYPRGPDSGFKVYPGSGKRYTYFDTPALSHALGEPCYIVRPLAPGDQPIPNGLPIFPVYFENDDDSRRQLGSDSRLTFTAPADGEYLVRVTDVRGAGFHGEAFRYELTVRPRRPDFKVTLHGAGPTVNAGSGREVRVTVDRIDGFDGPISVSIDNLPPGFRATSPIVIQEEQDEAFGAIYAAADAPAPTAENASASRVVATAEIHRETVTHDVNNLGEIKLAGAPKVVATIVADTPPQEGTGTGAPAPTDSTASVDPDAPLVLTIRPGETITASVKLDRRDHAGPVSFGNADSGRNLPHGIFVDNIGLNGLLILEGQDERQIFITAAKWVPEQTRLFHLKSDIDGGQTTRPVLLRVTP